MGFIEGRCTKCGAVNRESCNAWVYGSPIRTCKSCKSEYFDNRWREVAIDGFDPRANNVKLYLGATIGFLIMTIVCSLWLVYLINTQGHYPIKLAGCIFAGIIGTIGCFIVFLRSVTGYEDKQNGKFYAESLKRLENRDYIKKLIAYGYDVPEKFRQEESQFIGGKDL